MTKVNLRESTYSEATLMVGWVVRFYGISTIIGYLTPNPFLYKQSVLFQTIQFSKSTDFLYTQLNVKTVLY